MQPADVLTRFARPPDLSLTYGGLPEHVADLWLPAPAAATGVMVLFLHGGFWRAAFDRRHAGPLAEALTADGLAVCAAEYRRVGQQGGGWPGTFDDVLAAVTALPQAAAEAAGGLVDPARVIMAGHSAGGHLAVWAAGRLAADQRAEASAGARAVVSLAGVCDLAACYQQRLGRDAATELMGGGPDDHQDRYLAADPTALLPTHASVVLVHGLADDHVPWTQSSDYAERATALGDDVRCILLPDVGHLDLIDPLSAAWPAVLAEFRAAAARLPRP